MSALLIDIGNTRLKWAWCPQAGTLPLPWQDSGAVVHGGAAAVAADARAGADADAANAANAANAADPAAAAAAADAADRALAGLAERWRGLAGADVPRVWIANVAGAAVAARVEAQLRRAFGAAVTLQWVRTGASHGDLVNGYREPTQLGVDRWVGAIGAHRWLPRENLLIVTAGTATTLDIVTLGAGAAGTGQDDPGGNGLGGDAHARHTQGGHAQAGGARFSGGLILPGLALMLRALARNTAQLPALDVPDLAPAIAATTQRALGADNTEDAILAGCLAAQTGAIERTWRALAAAHGSGAPLRCLLSGGARHALAGALAMPVEMHDNLVLLGLHAMAFPR
ncbi:MULTISPECIES: type III pantothenate kinase [unclassified Cupriavidus]|uniref:type III pantothenate kinase n=1 Tax=Cupriavidus sp. H19C3 TaxID=3241603 RepID=UPI003BF7B3CC